MMNENKLPAEFTSGGNGVESDIHQKIKDLKSTKRAVNKYSVFLDDAFRIPILNIKIGFDAIVGLVPVLGDIVGALLSAVIVWKALRLGVSMGLVMQMLFNILVELIVGLIPVLGDIFDLVWRANRKNAALLEEHIDHRLEQYQIRIEEDYAGEKSGYLFPVLISAVLFVMLVLGFYWLTQWPQTQWPQVQNQYNELLELMEDDKSSSTIDLL